MAWANKEAFFSAKVPRERMSIPGVGDIWVYGLTCGEKDEYQNAVTQLRGSGRRSMQVKLDNARAQMMVMVVRDSQGRRIFAAADIGKILEIPAKIVEPILDKAWELSGMTEDEIEDIVKNSPTGPEQPTNGSKSD